MAKKVGYPFDKFMEWLQEDQDLSLITATGYASQSRRIIRHCGVSDVCNITLVSAITPEQVEKFILTLSKKSQTPFRRSWKQFYEFMTNKENKKIACIDLDRDWESVPPEIGKALREMNNQNFPFRLIPSMKWNRDEKLCKSLGKIVVVVGDRRVQLPTDPLLVITQWAYGDKTPNKEDYILPRKPHSPLPMPLSMMRKVAGIIA